MADPARVSDPVDNGPAAGGSAEPRLAATVALLRHGARDVEVLLTHRPATMAFGPGLHVFPGGRVDTLDHDPAMLERLRLPPRGDPAGLHGAAFVVAAIREAWEEAGVLLATGAAAFRVPSPPGADGASFRDVVVAHDLELRGDWLVPLSRWVTPPVVPRRYDARFFVAWLPDGALTAFDPREVAGHDWLTPGAALHAMDAGRIQLWTPTSTTLQQLAAVREPGDIRGLGPPGPPPGPAAEEVADTHGLVTRVTVGGAGGIPGRIGHAYLVGRERLVVVDPGDPNDEAVEFVMALAAARGAAITAVLLTAPVPERAAGAESLALRLGVPVLAAADARRVLAAPVLPVTPGEVLDLADTRIVVLAAGASSRGGEERGADGSAVHYAVPACGIVIRGGPEVERPSTRRR